MGSVAKSGNSCSVLCPNLRCWKFSSPMKMVFRFQCNARSIQCLSQSALHVAVVSLSVTVLITSTNYYPVIVPICLNLCILHSWGLVAFHSPWTWVKFQNSSQVQSLSFLHCCCSLSSDPALTPTSSGFSFASEYIGSWNNCPPPLSVSVAFIKGQLYGCCSLTWFSVSIPFDDLENNRLNSYLSTPHAPSSSANCLSRSSVQIKTKSF